MHTIIAAIAGTILLQRHLEGNVIKLNIFDTATIISTPIDFEDFECLFKISFNELTFHDRVPQLIMQGISNLIYNFDPHRRIRKCIKQFINTTYQELLMLGFNCPPNNKETTEQILGQIGSNCRGDSTICAARHQSNCERGRCVEWNVFLFRY